jgi:predicted glutamine amidotransferase
MFAHVRAASEGGVCEANSHPFNYEQFLMMFNMMITDGHRIFGTRFSSNPERGTRTFYYSFGSKFQCKDGISRMTETITVYFITVYLINITKLFHGASTSESHNSG